MSSYIGKVISKTGPTVSSNSASGIWTLTQALIQIGKSTWPVPIPPELYTFTSATFTPGGATFRTGPSLTQARTGLTGTGVDTWKNNTEYFNTSSGIQLWTVPATGNYSIDCYGAQGADGGVDSAGTPASSGGLGARIRGTLALTQGEVIRLVVGQRGATQTNGSWGGGGGGGGTFAWRPASTSTPLIAAGGGGSGGIGDLTQSGGQTSQNGTSGGNGGGAGGTNGNASHSNGICGGGGGQGWNGGPSYQCSGPFTWVALHVDPTGFSTGVSTTGGSGAGGFGGGGGSHGGGGGGGGYSGGGSGGWSYAGRGGGGGSFVSGTNTLSTAATHFGDGQIIITRL